MYIHIPPGMSGFLVALGVFLTLLGLFRLLFPHGSYTFNANDRPGAFDEHLGRYYTLAQVVIGLAAGSILLVVNGLKDPLGRLHWHFSSPLVLLAMSIVYAVVFLAFLAFFYEEFQHHPDSYSRPKHCLVNALGFGSLTCFSLGYLWLAFAIGVDR